MAKSQKSLKKQKRTDSWSNLVTLLGTSADKRMASNLYWDHHDPEFYEQMYAGGGIPARIVDLIPDEALRYWIDWTGVNKDTAEALHDKCEELDVRGALSKSWKWGRAYGGAVCHIVTDTPDPASPLQKGERVIGLRDLSRWDLRILTTDIEFDFGSPNWGHPRIYYLNVQMGSQYKGYPIHWTRMLRFDGQLVPRRTYIRNNYWHDSILNRLYNSIRNYETANDAAASCLADFNVDVFKMKNLANLIGAGKEQIVKNRIETIAYSKSVINSIIIDADDEEYENKQRSMQGFAELLVHQANRLVAETDIPHTKLLGESPDGSNATGNSTSQQWYNFIASEQENYLRPKLKRLVELLFPEIPNLGFKFKSLRTLDDIEKADLRLKIAQTDQIYHDIGALDSTEITESRWGGDEWSMETEIDEEGRAAGLIVPGQQEMPEGDYSPSNELSPPNPQDEPHGMHVAGGQAPEGKSSIETKPSEPEPGPMRGHEGEGKDITGKPKEEHPKPHEKPPEDSVEGQGIGELFSQSQKPGTEFDLKNQMIEGGSKKAEATFISQTMSEPMRDPRTDPHIKGPGIPNKARRILPTRGTGITAPSGYDFEKDKGEEGVPREATPNNSEKGSYYANHKRGDGKKKK
jgi:phage-related protein (TIGR01555 family)